MVSELLKALPHPAAYMVVSEAGASIDVQLRTSEHRSMYSYVRLSIIDVQLRTSEHRSMYTTYV